MSASARAISGVVYPAMAIPIETSMVTSTPLGRVIGARTDIAPQIVTRARGERSDREPAAAGQLDLWPATVESG